MITAAMVVHYIEDMDEALSFYKTALGLEQVCLDIFFCTKRPERPTIVGDSCS